MAPRSGSNGVDTDVDASMSEAPDNRIVEEMVSFPIPFEGAMSDPELTPVTGS
jgi:hypothetical protein